MVRRHGAGPLPTGGGAPSERRVGRPGAGRGHARWLPVTLAAVVVAVAGFVVLSGAFGAPGGGSARRAASYQLPDAIVQAPRPVREAYEFALERPDVLEWMPCTCGCVHDGHQHNRACFVASFEPDGGVTLDPHGLA